MTSHPPGTLGDTILISCLRLHATVGPDRWLKRRPQPITLSLSLTTSLAAAGRSDSVTDSIHYGDLAKELRRLLDGATAPSLRTLTEGAAVVALAKAGAAAVRIDATAENQFLRAERLAVQIGRTNSRAHGHAGAGEVAEQRGGDRECIQGLTLSVIIGVNPPERENKQNVKTDITFHGPTWEEPDWHEMHAQLSKAIEESSYLTLEAFATNVASVACFFPGADVVTIRAEKPSALVYAGASGVEITRSRALFTPTNA